MSLVDRSCSFIGHKMSQNVDFWELLLKAEDEGEALIQQAQADANERIDKRRNEATEQVEQLRQEYTDRLKQKTLDAEQLIADLKQDLASGEKAQKAESAAAVRNVKPQIVDLLLHAVLTVPIQ